MSTLQNSATNQAVASYLRHAIYSATHHLYLGLLAVALITLVAVLVMPRRFAAHRMES